MIDVSARTIAVSGTPPYAHLFWTTTFDEHGNPVRDEYHDGSVTEWTNEYDGSRLTSILVSPVAGNAYYRLESITYSYDDAQNPELWTRANLDALADGTVERTCVRQIEDGHPATFDCMAGADPKSLSTWRFSWENGRLVRADSDSTPYAGADGTPDIRYTWTYDDVGHLTGYQQDGTYDEDAPFIDGTPDVGKTFSAGCAPLIDRFRWLGHFGVENGANPQAESPATWLPR